MKSTLDVRKHFRLNAPQGNNGTGISSIDSTPKEPAAIETADPQPSTDSEVESTGPTALVPADPPTEVEVVSVKNNPIFEMPNRNLIPEKILIGCESVSYQFL